MVSPKWVFQLSFGLVLPIAAAQPPSAITVWALPNSDLDTTATFRPRSRASMTARKPGAAGTDDDHVVGVPFDLSHEILAQLFR